MTSKKEKILESAQRFILKGQIDRAIRDYQQVVAMDPRDNRYRQKLAELLVRDGRRDEAVEQFEDIARNYAENSYYLKAIAVYKQIQRLVPTDVRILLTLASLNHKQGLTGNALAEYGQVVAALEKGGELNKAVEVLEQMLSLDGQNLSTRMKYGEILHRVGNLDAAYGAFQDVLAALRTRGDTAGAERFAKKIQQLYPDRMEPGQKPSLDLQWDEPDAPAPETGAPVMAADFLMELPLSLDEDTAEPLPPSSSSPENLPPPPLEVTPPPSPAMEDAEYWEEEIELDLDDSEPGSLDLSPEADAPSGALTPPPDPFAAACADVASDAGAAAETDAAAGPAEASAEGAEGQTLDWLDLGDDFSFEEGPLVLAPPSSAAETGSSTGEVPPLDKPVPGARPQQPAPVEADLLGEALFPQPSTMPKANLGPEDEPTQPSATEGLAPHGGEPAAPLASAPLLSWADLFPEWGPDAGSKDLGELESHFDLGIGYKEMGMTRQAIRELVAAGENPRRRVDSLTLQAMCYRELGEPGTAEELLRKGRSVEGVSVEERHCMGYELALLCEGAGRLDEAQELFREVYLWDPEFQDVARKVGTVAAEEQFEEIELHEE